MQTDNPSHSAPTVRYRALPAQLVRTDDGVIVIRGCTEFRIIGDRAEETTQELLSLAADRPVALQEIVAHYAEPDRPSVEQLARQLIDRRIFIDAMQSFDSPQDGSESGLDIFYWNFGLTERAVTRALNDRRLVVIGVNAISRQLAAALAEGNIDNVTVVDYALLRNQRLFGAAATPDFDTWPRGCAAPISYAAWKERGGIDGCECLIATSDSGATSALLQWNRLCMERGIEYLPISLRRMIGQVGPYVVPGETACYQCLCARENSHVRDHESLRLSEEAAPWCQAVSGFFPSMASILGDIAVMELVKFHARQMPYKVGRLIEVNTLLPEMTTRRVLRVPRCEACAPTAKQSHHSLDRVDFIPGPQFFEGDKLPATPALTPAEKFGYAEAVERSH